MGDDGLTQSLSDTLKQALKKNSALRLAVVSDSDVVSVTNDSNLDWDKLDGRTVIIYTVHVFRGQDRGESNVGICYEGEMTKCVNAIIRLARIEAEGR